MIRSRRLVLVAAVVAFGLSACGNPNTTTPLADQKQPQVIQLASGQSGSGGAAPAAADSTNLSTESKIAFMGSTKFVYDGQMPALDGPAGSWFFTPGQKPDVDRIAKLAVSFGVQGDVRTLSADQGGGWAVGPEDYSAAVLTVSTDGMLTWYLSAAPTAISSVGCASGSGIAATEPAVGAPVAVDAVAPAETIPGADVPAVTAPATDVVAPDCAVPNPPAGVPTNDEALAKAKQLFADWGYDVNSFQFDDPYADEWGASVNASLLLEGLKAPLMLSVGFGENGTVTYASGYLATPERGADYPTIGAAAGLERLKAQNQFIGGLDRGTGVVKATDNVATADAPLVPDTVNGIAPVVEPTIVPCEPEAATVDCAPTQIDSIIVTLNSVKPDLTMVWAADNTIWLLPAYTFGSADGGLYTVNAVEDAYIHQADPAPATTEPVIDPGVVPAPDTAPASGGGSGGAPTPAPGVVGVVVDPASTAEPSTTPPTP
jgi:hypothetical protein